MEAEALGAVTKSSFRTACWAIALVLGVSGPLAGQDRTRPVSPDSVVPIPELTVEIGRLRTGSVPHLERRPIMASRPFTFGVRLRDKGRTVKVRAHDKDGRYVVEEIRSGRQTRRKVHPTLADALKDTAATWRNRLH